jgi:flagellar assembly protein FliH
MAVIKSDQSTAVLGSAIVLDMGDLARQAEQIKEAAGLKAEAIVREATQRAGHQAESAKLEAREQGHAEGLEKGLVEGREQGRQEALKEASQRFEKLDEAWTSAAADWEQQKERVFDEARSDVLELALRLAERVIHRTIEVDPTVIADRLDAALQSILQPLELAVRIHGQDREVLERTLPRLLAELPKLKNVTLIDDEQIERGGCVITYGQGRIDATIHTALRRIVELMLPEPEASSEPQVPTEPQPEAGGDAT